MNSVVLAATKGFRKLSWLHSTTVMEAPGALFLVEVDLSTRLREAEDQASPSRRNITRVVVPSNGITPIPLFSCFPQTCCRRARD